MELKVHMLGSGLKLPPISVNRQLNQESQIFEQMNSSYQRINFPIMSPRKKSKFREAAGDEMSDEVDYLNLRKASNIDEQEEKNSSFSVVLTIFNCPQNKRGIVEKELADNNCLTVTKGMFNVHGRTVNYDPQALFIFKDSMKIRQKVVWLIEWKYLIWLERFVILIIFLSSLSLAVYDQQDPNNLSKRNIIVQWIQYGFTVLFSLEALFKIIGMGLIVHKNAYLRDGWNWLDFIIVILGLFDWIMSQSFPSMPSMKSLRTLRVLRPLRSINAVPSMKRIIKTLLKSLPDLVNVALFMSFFFIVFGILGVQQFCGYFSYFCRMTPEPVDGFWPIDPDQPNLCSKDSGGLYGCNPMTWCGAPQDYGLPISIDSPDENASINFGITTFDHLGKSILTIFQVLTLSDWDYIMYNMMNANNVWLSAIYFFFVVILGTWFILNLILAVFMDTFKKVDEESSLKHLHIEQSDPDNDLAKDQKEILIQKVDENELHSDLKRDSNEETQKKFISLFSRRKSFDDNENEASKRTQKNRVLPEVEMNFEDFGNFRKEDGKENEEVEGSIRKQESQMELVNGKLYDSVKVFGSNKKLNQEQNSSRSSFKNRMNESKLMQQNEVDSARKQHKLDSPHSNRSSNREHIHMIKHDTNLNQDDQKQDTVLNTQKENTQTNLTTDIKTTEPIPSHALHNKFFYICFRICSHNIFNSVVMLAIFFNTIILSLDRYPIKKSESAYYDVINLVLTWFFILEMIIKLLGMNPKLYFRDKFGRFDFLIVVISLIEMIYEFSFSGTKKGTVSAFRAFRMIRIFKLARNWKSFQIMLVKIGATIKDVANYSVLLLIFMFTYSLLGMEFFAYAIKENITSSMNQLNGGPLDEVNGISPRTNFDNIWSSSTTVFQILIGDSWDNIMFDYVRINDHQIWPVMYFISLMLIGNMILIKLFSAILLKHFEDDDEAEQEVKQDMSNSQKRVFRIISWVVEKLKVKLNIKQDKQKKKPNNKNTKQKKSGAKKQHSKSKEEAGENLEKDTSKNLGDSSKQNNTPNNLTAKDGIEQTKLQNTVSNMLQNRLSNEISKQILQNQIPSIEESQSLPPVLQNLKGGLSVKDMIQQLQSQNSQDSNKNSPFMNKLYQQDYFEMKNNKDASKINSFFQLVVQANKKAQEGGVQEVNTEKEEGDQQEIDEQRVNAPGDVEKPKYTNQGSKGQDQRRKSLSKGSTFSWKKGLDSQLEGRSLYIFGPLNKLRVFLGQILNFKNFDNLILTVIIISSVMLILQNPLNDPESQMTIGLDYADIVISAIFVFESIIKIITYGLLFNGNSSYLRSGWNVLDFVIVAISLLSYTLTSVDLQILKVLRLLRVMRPLRMISKNEGLKICVKSLLFAIPGIVNVLVLSLIFLLIFGIFFTNLLKGKFLSCYLSDSVQSDTGVRIEMVDHKWGCLSMGGEWIDQDNNFNNLMNSMYTLFAVATTDNWAITLYNAIDATQIDYQPKIDSNYYFALLFCAFTTFGFLFILNLFMEVVVNTFHTENEKVEKINMITESQKEWVETQILSLNCKPLKKRIDSQSKVRNWCVYIVEAKYFERFILLNIFLNTVVLTLYWVNISIEITTLEDKLNYFFVSIFTVEAILKMIAYGKLYFNSGWNWFDFLIVLLAWLGIALKLGSQVQVVAETTLIRAFRICRIFRLIKKAKALNAIFNSLIITLPALGNLGALLLLIMYLYAILGMNLFGTIQLQDNINPNVNFQTFGFALLALFRVATGDNWQDLMYDCMLSNTIISPCIENPSYQDYLDNNLQTVGCGSSSARIYFISFTLLVTYVQLNLFLAIIIQGFSDSNSQINYKITEQEFEQFQEIWSEFDPDGTGFIKMKELPHLIKRLIAVDCNLLPMKDVLASSEKEIELFIDYLELHSCNKFQEYQFTDVLNSLCTSSLKINLNKKEEFDRVNQEIFEKFGVTISSINEMVQILERLGDHEKIKICQKLTNKRDHINSKIIKSVDHYEGNYYDSRHIIRIQKIQGRIREFVIKMRERKAAAVKLGNDTEQDKSLLTELNKNPLEEFRNSLADMTGTNQYQQMTVLSGGNNQSQDFKGGVLSQNFFSPDQKQDGKFPKDFLQTNPIMEEENSSDGTPTHLRESKVSDQSVKQYNLSRKQTAKKQSEVINFYTQTLNMNQIKGLSDKFVEDDSIESLDQEEVQPINHFKEVSSLLPVNSLSNNLVPIQDFQTEIKEFSPINKSAKSNFLEEEERGGCVEDSIDTQKHSPQKFNSDPLEELKFNSIPQEESKMNLNQNSAGRMDEEEEKQTIDDFVIREGRTGQHLRRNNMNQMSNFMNTSMRNRKKLQPQQKDRKFRQMNINNPSPVQNQNNSMSPNDSSNQSRRIYFNNQIQSNLNASSQREVRQQDVVDDLETIVNIDNQAGPNPNYQFQRPQLPQNESESLKRKIIIYNLDQKQFESYVNLIKRKQSEERIVGNIEVIEDGLSVLLSGRQVPNQQVEAPRIQIKDENGQNFENQEQQRVQTAPEQSNKRMELSQKSDLIDSSHFDSMNPPANSHNEELKHYESSEYFIKASEQDELKEIGSQVRLETPNEVHMRLSQIPSVIKTETERSTASFQFLKAEVQEDQS